MRFETLNRLERSTLALGALAAAAVLFVSLNIFASGWLRSAQLDLTQDRLYTLSPGTVEILRSIDEPITLRFFLSRQLTEQSPVHANYANRVRELLERYAALAGGKIRLESFSPEPFSPDDDRAMASGLQGVPVDTAGGMAYFGLSATNSTDDQQVIAFFSPDREQYLEYDLTKLIYSLNNPRKPSIGLLTSLPLAADPKRQYQPWPIYQELAQFFTIRSMRGKAEIPDDIDVLLILHPKLTEAETYAVDQFVLRGGKALILVDPHFEGTQRDVTKGPPKEGETSSDLKQLFDAWGVEFPLDTVVADRTVAQQVDVSTGDRALVTDYVVWLALRGTNFTRDDVVTSQMARINMASAGYFTLLPGAKTELKPLIQTTPEAQRVGVEDVNFFPDPSGLLDRFKSENRRFTVAARLTGPARSIYPDGPPWEAKGGDGSARTKPPGAAEEEAAPKRAHLAQSAKPINVVLVGDVDLVADRFWLQEANAYGRRVAVPVANNAEFVVNVLDNLGGSDALISLRSRGLSYRPFVRTEEIRRDAEARYRETEQELAKKLKETEAKLDQLRAGQGAAAGSVLTDEQRAAIENFRTEAISLRRQLRDVQHALRKDIEALDTRLKVINIWAMPLAVSGLALVLLALRQARRRRRILHG